MNSTSELIPLFQKGNTKALSRALTIVENDLSGSEEILTSLYNTNSVPVIGITGPPGAGKSTLVNALISSLSLNGKKIGILAVDPSSPFNFGALLGDRVRLSTHFNNENIFIRSVASRGSLGGLSEKIMEMTDVMRSAGFDYIFIETVGVGQSEVEIAGLADITIVVLVPQSGDEVQAMKAGLMEIADIFVVNKSDEPGSDSFVKNLKSLLNISGKGKEIPVIKTTATNSGGIEMLLKEIDTLIHQTNSERKNFLLVEKALHIIRNRKMKPINRTAFRTDISEEIEKKNFNLYKFVKKYI